MRVLFAEVKAHSAMEWNDFDKTFQQIDELGDGVGDGEVSFAEFCLWWETQERETRKLAARFEIKHAQGMLRKSDVRRCVRRRQHRSREGRCIAPQRVHSRPLRCGAVAPTMPCRVPSGKEQAGGARPPRRAIQACAAAVV